MPTAANEGKWRPTKNRYVFFCTVHFIFYFLITTKPTKANNGQCRPTQVNKGPQQPTKANAGPRQPTQANKANAGQQSQRKPTQASPPRPRRTFIGIFFSFTQKLSLF